MQLLGWRGGGWKGNSCSQRVGEPQGSAQEAKAPSEHNCTRKWPWGQTQWLRPSAANWTSHSGPQSSPQPWQNPACLSVLPAIFLGPGHLTLDPECTDLRSPQVKSSAFLF